jgi:hypothetical protein
MQKQIGLVFFLFFISSLFVRAEIEWQAHVDCGSLFPSFIISTATVNLEKVKAPPNYIGEPLGQVGCTVTSPRDDCPFTVEVSSPKFIRQSSIEGRLPKAGEKYNIYPKLDYDYDALYSVIEPVPETISVKLKLAGEEVGTQKKTVEVRSVQDCLFAFKHDDGKIAPYEFEFAAYVNENNPLIDRILKRALDLKLVNNFDGYQSGATGVYEQAFAVWNVLQRQGIKYSSITTPSVESEKVFSQHVRSLEDSVANTQANCVDGSVLFASIFRKIGLKTFLVIIPGHCFMDVVEDEAAKKVLVIETTMIGNVDLKQLSLERGINALASGRKNNSSRTSFEQATQYGAKEFQEALLKIKNRTPGYYLIDIDKCRKLGIQPLKSKLIR